MNSQPNLSDAWTPCEPGQLQALSERLRRRRSPSMTKAAGVAMAATAASVLLAGLAMNFFADRSPAPISCQAVGANLAAYVNGACPEKLHARIQLHLQRCPRCVEHLEEFRSSHARVPPGRLEMLAATWGAPRDDAGRSR